MKKLLIILTFIMIPKIAFAAYPWTFTNGTVADATAVNANSDYFENKYSPTSGHDHNGVNSKKITDGSGITQVGTLINLNVSGTSTVQDLNATGDVVINGTFTASGDIVNSNVVHYSETRFKVGTFSRDISLSSDLSITGVGFKPTAIFMFGSISGSVYQASYCGVDDAALAECIFDYGAVTPNVIEINTQLVTLRPASDKSVEGKIKSFDSNGFTMQWALSGSPTGTATLFYLAFR